MNGTFHLYSNFDRIFNIKANSGDPNQTPHSVASVLGLHCSPMSHKKDARLKWVKRTPMFVKGVCLRVVKLDPKGKNQRVPVKIFNVSARKVQIEPRTPLCELQEVRVFICALWSPAGKGLTSWLSFVVSTVSLSLSHWYPGSGVVLDCIDS